MEIDEDTLIGQLTDLDRNELGKLLFNANPIYFNSFPEATDKNEEWGIPNDYNFWTTDQKQAFVIKCINQTTGNNEGSKINDIRSAIIESFLTDE